MRAKAEFLSKLSICIKEADESLYWLELLRDAEVFTENQLSSIMDETDQIIAILTSMSKKAKSAHTSK